MSRTLRSHRLRRLSSIRLRQSRRHSHVAQFLAFLLDAGLGLGRCITHDLIIICTRFPKYFLLEGMQVLTNKNKVIRIGSCFR